MPWGWPCQPHCLLLLLGWQCLQGAAASRWYELRCQGSSACWWLGLIGVCADKAAPGHPDILLWVYSELSVAPAGETGPATIKCLCQQDSAGRRENVVKGIQRYHRLMAWRVSWRLSPPLVPWQLLQPPGGALQRPEDPHRQATDRRRLPCLPHFCSWGFPGSPLSVSLSKRRSSPTLLPC
jgi:hypothetical protein